MAQSHKWMNKQTVAPVSGDNLATPPPLPTQTELGHFFFFFIKVTFFFSNCYKWTRREPKGEQQIVCSIKYGPLCAFQSLTGRLISCFFWQQSAHKCFSHQFSIALVADGSREKTSKCSTSEPLKLSAGRMEEEAEPTPTYPPVVVDHQQLLVTIFSVFLLQETQEMHEYTK